MALTKGQYFEIYKVPIPLYGASDLAAIRRPTGNTVNQTGKYLIDAVWWTDPKGGWYQTQPASGGIPIYNIRNLAGTYGIGWVREDDNLIPSTIASVPDMQVNGSIVVNFNQAVPGLTHQIEIKIGSTSIKNYDNLTAYNCTISFTSAEQNTIYGILNNTTLGSMRVVLRTYLNGTQVGSYRATDGRLFVPSTIVPKFTANPTVTIVTPVGGKAFQNISALTVTGGTVAPGTGASISSTLIQVDTFNNSSAPYTSPVINKYGAIPVSVIVTDSRSRTATYSTTVNFEQYGGVNIESFTGVRTTGDAIKFGGFGSFTGTLGKPTYVLDKRVKGTTAWTTVTSGTVGGPDSNTMVFNGTATGFSTASAYDLRVTITDGAGKTVTSFLTIWAEGITAKFGKHGASFGKKFNNLSPYNVQVAGGGLQSDGQVQINKNDNALQLKGDTRVFQEFFKAGVRKGYLGFPTIGSNNLSIANEAMGMTLDLGKELTYGGEIIARSKLVTNANGSYIRFPDQGGFTIAWREITIPRTAGQNRTMPANPLKPITFRTDLPMFGGLSTDNNAWQDAIDIASLVAVNYNEAWRITSGLESGAGVWKNSGYLKVQLWAIGFS